MHAARFVVESNNKKSPDIEIQLTNGAKLYYEVMTFTNARNWAQIKHARTPSAQQKESLVYNLEQKVNDKVRDLQLPVNGNGTVVFNAPFEKVSNISVEGWTDVLWEVRKNGEH